MQSFLRKLFSNRSQPQSTPYAGKIEVFSRHCLYSSASAHKKRFPSFSREACYRNLLGTIDFKQANLTFILDTACGTAKGHYIEGPFIEIKEGTEAGAFLKLLEHVSELPLHPETILYFVEDDYVHKPGWTDVLREGFDVPGADYVTLYDHRDKYFLPMYQRLKSEIFYTKTCHWRTAPSTTQTFALKFKTLLRDLDIHQRFSTKRKISADHEKFLSLQKRGARLISCIPGWSTHAEPEFSSPCIDWESYLTKGKSYVCESDCLGK